MTISELKKLSKEEFLTYSGLTEEIYEALQKSKEGWIKISRVTDEAGDQGFTYAFGEGISCKVSNPETWYVTSVIQSIDWENHTFKTLNSTYNFEFKDTETLEKERKEYFEMMNQKFKEFDKNNGSKN
jgi:hypothetical protein